MNRPVVRSPAARRAEVAAVFDAVAEDYDDVGVPWFSPVARRLVDLLSPRPGERALDIGCGRGAALFELAAAVGPTGSATGIDLAEKMIACTARDPRCHRPDAAAVELLVQDAARPSLPTASYDVAAASFVLFFLPAPGAAIRAWRELLAPGGRLGVTTFAQHRGGWLEDVLDRFLPDASRTGAVGPSAFDTDAGVEDLFRAAGFTGVGTWSLDAELVFAGVQQWHAWSWSHGQRAVWQRIAVADRPRAVAAAADQLHRFRQPDGRIVAAERVRATLGRRPPGQ
jgi:ubiquinone/menaquinone biosynthesis C-methylase UbiE